MNHTQLIREDFDKWYKSVIANSSAWEGNNLHIDEVNCCNDISRSSWVEKSFDVFNYFVRYLNNNSLIFFLHFDLEYSKSSALEEDIDLKWLKDNISEFTPPSFNFCSKDYFGDFYKKKLTKINLSNNIKNLINLSENTVFYFRSFFDLEENLYSRELYIYYLHNNVRDND